MKKLLSIIAGLLLTTISVYSQAPAIFNYQGVARNSVGNALINKTITLRLTIHDATAGGAIVYQESRITTTNPFGLFNVQVGSPGATSVTGTIPGVNWALNAKFIQVEIDPNGGSTFINIGTAQIASVPYAWYSAVSGDLTLPFNKTQADNGTLFKITNSGNASGSTALEGLTNSTAANAFAIIGTVTSVAPGANSTGVRGINNGTGALGIGVWGSHNGGGWGVYGTAVSGIGVNGNATTGIGVNGASTSGDGVHGSSTSAFGVSGVTAASNGAGVLGDGTGTGVSTGVLGRSGEGAYPPIALNSGVLGRANANVGVQGLSISGIGIRGESGSGAGVYGTSNTSRAGFFENTNAANLADALFASTNGGVSSWALRATSTGAQGAGIFTYNNAAGTANTVRITNNGSGTGVYSTSTGTGMAGFMENTNLTNPNNTFQVIDANLTTFNFNLGNAIYAQRSDNIGATFFYVIPTTTTSVSRTGFGIQGTSETGTGIAALTNTGIALRAFAFAPAAYALQTAGQVQISGQGAALNRVLTSDAVGNATWQALGAIGGVTGSGTVNFIPKWTPIGTNLGNSQIFDDASRVNIGTNFGDANSLTINNTNPGGVGNATLALQGGGGLGQEGGIYLENSTGDMHFTLNNYVAATGAKVMTLEDVTLNVGVGTVTPGARMHVNGSTNTPVILGIFSFDHQAIIGKTSTVATANTARGIVGYADNSTVENQGLFGFANRTGTANNVGVFSLSFGTSSNTNYAYYGNAFNATGSNVGIQVNVPAGPNDFAGIFNGKVQINDGTAAVGRIFTSTNGIGTGTWSTAAGAGLVSGSGTLNFMPKWTPNGTTLGNSNVWVDPTNFSTQINTTTMPVVNALNVAGGWNQFDGTVATYPFLYLNSPGVVGANGGIVFGASTGGADNGRMLFRSVGDYIAIAHRDGGASTNGLSDLVVKNGNVGIATTAPIARLHINNAATGAGGMQLNQDNELTIPGIKLLTAGPILFDVSTLPLWGNNGVYSQRQDFTSGTIFSHVNEAAFQSIGQSSNGLEAGTVSGIGVYAFSQTGTGVFSFSQTGIALNTQGAVRMTGIGEVANAVLTSDALGNATWQGYGGISLRTFPAGGLIIPTGVDIPITQWLAVEYESGGSNYNPLTGEYTIPVTGIYQISVDLTWNPFVASGAILTSTLLYLNGGFAYQTTSDNSTTSFNTTSLNHTRSLVAGTVVQIHVVQNSGSPQTILGAPFSASSFSINMLHK